MRPCLSVPLNQQHENHQNCQCVLAGLTCIVIIDSCHCKEDCSNRITGNGSEDEDSNEDEDDANYLQLMKFKSIEYNKLSNFCNKEDIMFCNAYEQAIYKSSLMFENCYNDI